MSAALSTWSASSDYDDFLFSSLGEDKKGMPLSVLSLLARLNLDPRLEAAQLSQLPPPAAILRLAWLLESLPEGLQVFRHPNITATELVALLPHDVKYKFESVKKETNKSLYSTACIVLFSMFFVLLFCFEYYPSESIKQESSQGRADISEPVN